MAVPARQRESLAALSDGQIVITVDTQTPCLVMYALPEWERIERDVQALPALNPAVKRFQRLMLGYASDLQLDSNGRVLVPPSLREYAQLEKRAVMVGQGNKLELVVRRIMAEGMRGCAVTGPPRGASSRADAA